MQDEWRETQDELDALRAELATALARAHNCISHMANVLVDTEARAAGEIDRLRANLDELRGVLEWYAKPDNWAHGQHAVSFAQADAGKRARGALGIRAVDNVNRTASSV